MYQITVKNQTYFRQKLSSLFVLGCLTSFLLITGSGCRPPQELITGTKIPATPVNLAIYKRIDEYVQAIQTRDIGKLVTMAHPSYESNGGTVEVSDDYNRTGLREILERRLPRVRSMQLSVRVLEILMKEDIAKVRLKYSVHFQLATERGDRWYDAKNDKEMELQKEGNQWYFRSGY